MNNQIKEEVISGCEAFHNEKGDSACLLIHGLCGSPYEVSKLSAYLNTHDYTTSGPRFPGHGTKGKIMDLFTWRDWFREVENTYLELVKNYKKVYIIGFSTGGTIGLKLATLYPVEKLVTISTFIATRHRWYTVFRPETYLNTVGKLFNYLPTIPPPNLSDPEERKAYKGSEYISLNAIRNTFELVEDVKKNVYKVTCPVLIIHSRRDSTTCPGSADFVYENISSKDKEIMWLEKPNHIIPLDYDKEIVFEKIVNFIEKKTE